jgi:hypothetical protein
MIPVSYALAFLTKVSPFGAPNHSIFPLYSLDPCGLSSSLRHLISSSSLSFIFLYVLHIALFNRQPAHLYTSIPFSRPYVNGLLPRHKPESSSLSIDYMVCCHSLSLSRFRKLVLHCLQFLRYKPYVDITDLAISVYF